MKSIHFVEKVTEIIKFTKRSIIHGDLKMLTLILTLAMDITITGNRRSVE